MATKPLMNRSESVYHDSDDVLISEDIPGIDQDSSNGHGNQQAIHHGSSTSITTADHTGEEVIATNHGNHDPNSSGDHNIQSHHNPNNAAETQANAEAQNAEAISNNAATRRKEISPADFYFGVTLGEGAYARVVHARMKRGNMPDFAIKIMEKDHIKKENKVKYVMMEKNILSKMSHPFIIKFYFSFQDAGYLYMCMDLAPGGELLGLINARKKLKQSQGLTNQACDINMARFYAAEIVEALEYLHNHGVIHRDMKPENVLLGSDGHIKVTDFGTALLEADVESSRSSFVGTAEYVSPEVLRNEDVTKSCDHWALGCIIYQMLTGITPFQAASEYLIFQCILDHSNGNSSVSYPAHMSPSSQDIICQLLHSNPSERIGATDMDLLKSHPFFMEESQSSDSKICWGDLGSIKPPYIPPPESFPRTDNMRNGADEDWIDLLEGEATPILGGASGSRNRRGSDDDNDNDFNKPGEEQNSHQVPISSTSQSPSTAKSTTPFSFTSLSVSRTSKTGGVARSGSVSMCSDVSIFLDANEKTVFTGIVLKRVGLFSKRRQLILSDRPRLLYFDPGALEMKGIIPWTADHPVKCEKISEVAFDIICTKTGRRYHMSAIESGSVIWVDLINAMIAKQNDPVENSYV